MTVLESPATTVTSNGCPVSVPLSLQTCSNEVRCICDADYTGKDCSVFDPVLLPTPMEGPEKYKGTAGGPTYRYSPFTVYHLGREVNGCFWSSNLA